MCIVADSVNDVSKTKIASFHVGYSLDDKKTVLPAQLIVYAADVDSNATSNAFILPVYNPGNDYKKIIPLDFSELPDFFTQTKSIFERWFPKKYLARSMNYSSNSFDTDSYLPVHKVGDYKFSIMPSKMDFNRLDRSQLNVNPAAKSVIDFHSNDYSFIIYQFFQRGKIEITPFAYLCEPYNDQAMIIPTIHGHPHEIVPTGMGHVQNLFVPNKPDFEENADFDHVIYSITKQDLPKSIITKKDLTDMNDLLRQITKDYMNRKIRVFCPKSFVPNKIDLTGYKDNRNTMITRDGSFFMRDLIVDN